MRNPNLHSPQRTRSPSAIGRQQVELTTITTAGSHSGGGAQQQQEHLHSPTAGTTGSATATENEALNSDPALNSDDANTERGPVCSASKKLKLGTVTPPVLGGGPHAYVGVATSPRNLTDSAYVTPDDMNYWPPPTNNHSRITKIYLRICHPIANSPICKIACCCCSCSRYWCSGICCGTRRRARISAVFFVIFLVAWVFYPWTPGIQSGHMDKAYRYSNQKIEQWLEYTWNSVRNLFVITLDVYTFPILTCEHSNN
jgi:hypothetical protein